jgi:UDP-N-acetylmuramoylalanine--D-glutamate ligase
MREADRNSIGFSLERLEGMDFGLIQHQGETYLAEGKYPLLPINKIKLAGKHNIANILAALALGSAMALPMDAMLSAIEVFKGLPHRCLLVGEKDDVRWFNDSKATNVGSTIAAIEGLAEQGQIILIAGGVGKGQSFEELTPILAKAAKAVVLIGEAASEIAQAIPNTVQTIMAEDLTAAVNEAKQLAKATDMVLLSPACASFDMFSGYEDRGHQYEKAVKEALHD